MSDLLIFRGRKKFLFLLFSLIAVIILAIAVHLITTANTLGIDFATFWLAAKSALFQGKSPYSQEVTNEAQLFIYHRLANPGEDQVAFAYPFQAVFLIAPFAWMDFTWAQAFWMSLMIVALLAALLLFNSQCSPLFKLSFFFFYPVIFGVVLGNFAIFFTAVILFFFSQIYLSRSPSPVTQIICAALLSFSAVKPQFSWAYLLLAGLIAIKFHYRLFLIVLLSFSTLQYIVAFFWRPSWFVEWLQALKAYSTYNKSDPTLLLYLQKFLPPNWVFPLAGILLTIFLFFLIYLVILWWKNKSPITLLPAWLGFLTYLIHPHGISYEQLTFLIPFFLWIVAGPSSKTIKFIWFSSIFLSWGLYLLSSNNLIPDAANQYPFLFYSLWLAWFTVSGLKWRKLEITAPNPIN